MASRGARRGSAWCGAIVLAAAGLVALPGAAQAAQPGVPPAPVVTATRAKDGTAPRALKAPPSVAWPASGTVEVAPVRALGGERDTWSQADGLPVRVGGVAGRVRVQVLDHGAAVKAGVPGVLLRVDRADDLLTATEVPLEMDYSGFRNAYGGDYAARLTFVRLPGCVVSTPEKAACRRGASVPTRNDLAAGRASTTVTLPARTASLASAGRQQAVYALTAAPSGSAGSFKATSLAPSATWQVGTQSGDFMWSYDMPVPPAPGDLAPDLRLSYSSGGLDGHVAATNNQPGWVGDGFDLQPGFIERSYKSCKDDGVPDSTNLCWSVPNATIVLPGLSSELVPGGPDGTWRAENDEGWRVELLTGAVNGDDDGEYWRATSPDGTRYFLGRHQLPGWSAGRPVTNSVWTVPVYGNNAGEPCNASVWCQQGYRWNLDYVVDRHGNAMSYFYDRDVNFYNRSGVVTEYVRSGQVARIDYGQRDGEVFSTVPVGRVEFTAGDRCIPGSACTQSSPQDWPDVPFDQACGSGSCAVVSPTFWTTKRLAKVTTLVASGGDLVPVDSWTLTHTFPATSEGNAVLWLQSVQHTGLVGGGSATTPAVTFGGQEMQNRVSSVDDGWLKKWRLNSIVNETGGQITIKYADVGCTSGLPAVDDNRLRCYPSYWVPEGGSTPVLDWVHKYVVSETTETDLTTPQPAPKTTQYEYITDSGAAPNWHYDEPDLVPAGQKSWGQFRGFDRVKVRTGAPTGARTLVEYRFLRGMNGDKRLTNATRDVKIVDWGGIVPDDPALRGFTREVTTYNGDGGPIVDQTLYDPVAIGPNATRVRDTGSQGETYVNRLDAYLTRVTTVSRRTTLGDGSVRSTRRTLSYDAYGSLIKDEDLGDVATPADDTCTQTTYARNTAAWLINFPSRVEAKGVACAATASYPDDAISDERYYYDDPASAWNAAPTIGDVARTERLASWGSGPGYAPASRTVHDAYGRVIEAYDAVGNKTATAYTSATGGPVTSVRTTDAVNHSTLRELAPANGQPTATVDANGNRTELSYDPLGRLIAVRKPGQSAETPGLRFQYAMRNDAPTVVTTETLQGTGTYTTSTQLLDGFLRERQTQAPSPSGGRIVTDTFYDGNGRVAKRNGAYSTSGAPGGTWVATNDLQVPSQTVYGYDGADRQVSETLRSKNNDKWQTTTAYGGNSVTETPPAGGIRTVRIFDARDRVVELREYKTATEYDTTRYAYTKAGQLASVTDPAGNVWRHGYDLRGRETSTEHPDQGTSTATYDDADRVLTATDSRGKTLTYSYDAIGRRTGAYEGATRLAGWTYDTAANGLGLPATATRYVGTDGYNSEVRGYDARGRATNQRVTIPPVEGDLQGSYDTAVTYNDADQVATVTPPAAGGLPPETMTIGYDKNGLETGLSGYVTGVRYTALAQPAQYTLGAAGSQVYRVYTYDDATARLTRLITSRAGMSPAVVSDLNYTYDPAGNVTRLADGTTDTQCFRYDGLRRLTDAWTATDNCAGAPNLGGTTPYWHGYAYDVMGNRTQEVQHAGAGNTTRDYSYAGAQPHAVKSVTTSGPGGNRTDTYAYDSAGNTTGRPGQTLAWDAQGGLVSAGSTSYLYDADGGRLIRRAPDGTTLYLGGTELRLAGGKVTGTRYYEFRGDTVAVRRVTDSGTSLSWLGDDQQGTAAVALDAGTRIPDTRRQLPFGAPRGTAPANWPGERGFVGGTMDPSTGLTRLGARDYDPGTGRFLSVDPIVDSGDPQQMNGYAYASNNPTTFTDPDGRLVVKPPAWGYAYLTNKPRPLSDKLQKLLDHPERYFAGPDEPAYDGTWYVDPASGPRDVRFEDLQWSPDGYYGGPYRAPKKQSPLRSPESLSDPSPSPQYPEPRPCLGWNQCLDERPVEYPWWDSGSAAATVSAAGQTTASRGSTPSQAPTSTWFPAPRPLYSPTPLYSQPKSRSWPLGNWSRGFPYLGHPIDELVRPA
jgi:RHS repeat-associated protein